MKLENYNLVEEKKIPLIFFLKHDVYYLIIEICKFGYIN